MKRVKDISGKEPKVLKIQDAPEYFDEGSERDAVVGMIKNIFNRHPDKVNHKVYGLTPEEYMRSTENVAVKLKQQQAVDDSLMQAEEEEKKKNMCSLCKFKKKKDDVDAQINNNLPWSKKIIISHESGFVHVLDFVVKALELISCYFYGYLAAFRYSDLS